MISAQTTARHNLFLNQMKNILAEAEVESTLIEANQDIPLSMLIVPMESDSLGRARAFTCSFIPLDDEDLEFTSLLQFYVGIPFPATDPVLGEILSLFSSLNLLQPIGHFGVKDPEEIYLRYVLAIPQQEALQEGSIIETIMMLEYAVNTYQDLIESVASGLKTAQQAMKGIEEEDM